ncbi:MAG: TolC family protein [Polyangiaceae bacterium]|nr:TolC family protein [Polyangiaceae bacterium]
MARSTQMMARRSLQKTLFAVVSGAVTLLGSTTNVFALQPLPEFLRAAKSNSVETREAKATAAQREAEVDQAWGKIFPSLSARGQYIRNEFAAEVNQPGSDPIIITPKDQLEATITLEVPLVDVASWSRIGAAKAAAKAASARADLTALDVERAIAQRYTQAIAGRGLVQAAERALAAAKASQAIAGVRKDLGATAGLEVDRAEAEVARAEQNLADAKQVESFARRALQSLSGLAPSQGAPVLTDDLKDEGTLESWEKEAKETPGVKAAMLEKEAADKQVTAAWTQLLPTVTASANERFTNATGFAGQNAYWTLALTASWRLDFGTVRQIGAQKAASDAATARHDRTERDAKDRVFESFEQVKTQIAKSKAARSQVKAASHAAAVARDRYANGAGTQLDVIQADRDAFQAEVSRIQADSDLVFARLALRLAAGKPIDTVAITSGGSAAVEDSATLPNKAGSDNGGSSDPGKTPAPQAPAAPGVESTGAPLPTKTPGADK